MSGLKKQNIIPAAIIGIQSQEQEVKFLVQEEYLASELHFIPEKERDVPVLSDKTKRKDLFSSIIDTSHNFIGFNEHARKQCL
jgi:hypothetical protein